MSQTFFSCDKYQGETMWRRKYLLWLPLSGGISPRPLRLRTLCSRWGRTLLCLEPMSEADYWQSRSRKETGRSQETRCAFPWHAPSDLPSMMPLYYKSTNGLCHRLGQSPQVSLEMHLHTHPEMCFTSLLGIPRFSQVDSQDWPPQMWYRGYLARENFSSGQSREKAHGQAI